MKESFCFIKHKIAGYEIFIHNVQCRGKAYFLTYSSAFRSNLGLCSIYSVHIFKRET